MLSFKRRARLTAAQVASLPYKPNKSSEPVAEDILKCVSLYGNAYEMILSAIIRAKEISTQRTRADYGKLEQPSYPHQPTVTAMLEIQHGTFDKEKYRALIGKPKKKAVM